MTFSLCNTCPGKLLSKFISYYSLCGWLSWYACIKVQYGCIFHPPKHNRAHCNSLKNLKTIKGPYSGPISWSQTLWPYSFQQYILPGFLMTTPQSFAQQVPTWSNRRIPPTKRQYLQGPKHSSWIYKNHGPKQYITILKINNTSKYIAIWHACTKPSKIDHAKICISNVLLFLFIIKFLLPCLLVCKPLRNMHYLITPSPGCFSI